MEPDVGSALTGQQVAPAQAAAQWDDYLQRPGNRQALLQIGLQMMQPVGIGQTPGGHIAQSIGAGGEAVDRAAAGDLRERIADSKLAVADEKLRIAQQNADSGAIRANAAASRATGKKVGGLTDLMRERFARQDATAYERQLERDAKDLAKQANDVMTPADSDVVKRYKGKTPVEIREMLRAERPMKKAGAGAESALLPDDTEDTSSDTQQAPPYPGAQLAEDGNWYVKKDGKVFRVKP